MKKNRWALALKLGAWTILADAVITFSCVALKHYLWGSNSRIPDYAFRIQLLLDGPFRHQVNALGQHFPLFRPVRLAHVVGETLAHVLIAGVFYGVVVTVLTWLLAQRRRRAP